jgi:hypothetical protein
MSYEWNGLLDSALPNVYINRITLEQKNLKPLSNNPYDITPHIDQSKLPTIEGSPTPSLTPTAGGSQETLKVVFDTFLEFPNLSDDDFFSLESLKDHLNIKVLLFGPNGKSAYDFLNGPNSLKMKYLTNDFWMGQFFQGYTDIDVETSDYVYKSFPMASMANLFNEIKDGHETATLKHVKQKYSKTLPDGTTVYKIPMRLELEYNNSFPPSLFALVYCALDVEALDLESYGATAAQADDATESATGRIASEVIIQNSKIQDKGMMFFVSNDQSVPDNDDLSMARNAAFNNLKGQLWFGGVHRMATYDPPRYMAGNSHDAGMHPFLDYVVVANRRIQDFRTINVMQKKLMNLNPITELVFGGNYTDLRSNTAAKSFDDPALFSNLISSVNQKGFVKLFFSIDMGKLIRKHCDIPALLDKAAIFPDGGPLSVLLSPQNLKPLSFRVFRERIDVPNSVANQEADRKLIYDKYPQYYFFDEATAEYKHEAPAKKAVLSSLVPVQLDAGKPNFNGSVKHYSLTDYSIDKSEGGKYRYSVEVEVADPTVPYLVSQYKKASSGLQMLKEFVSITVDGTGKDNVGAAAPAPFYNSYLGGFNLNAPFNSEMTLIEKVNQLPGANDFIEACQQFEFLTTTLRDDWVQAISALAAEDDVAAPPPGQVPFTELFLSMLDLNSATPQSIVAVHEMFSTLTSQLKNTIEAFSTAKIPKADTGEFCCDESGNAFSGSPLLQTKMPIGSAIPQRKIMVHHIFDDGGETVTTEQLDAGYDFLASQVNQYDFNNGLKVINWSSYDSYAHAEHSHYFSSKLTPARDKIKMVLQFGGDNSPHNLTFSILPMKGRFLTIPEQWASQPYVRLPSTIVDPDDNNDKSFWKAANNIIRYKFSLFGNPDSKSFLGYGDDKIPGFDISITPTMERIIKEYQSLNFKGTVFGRQQYRASEISSVNKSGDHVENMAKDFTPPETGFINAEGEPLESDDSPNIKLPWAENIGQEDFLLALIMQNYLNLGFWDTRLRAFDPSISASPMGVYLNNALYDAHPIEYYLGAATPGASTTLITAAVGPALNNLPNQIKVLIINNGVGAEEQKTMELLHPAKQYAKSTTTTTDWAKGEKKPEAITTWQQSTLYSPPAEYLPAENTTVERNQMMFLNRFGEFWFRHQNIVEIEYLSGYSTTQAISDAPFGYDNKYNSSVKAPIWSPLNLDQNPTGGLLLCRLKKYKNPTLFNQHIYDILDLPLYDEYFFIKPDGLTLQGIIRGPEHAAISNYTDTFEEVS